MSKAIEENGESILLKIKREFTTNEAVQYLLKLVSDLEMEIGILKSELSEAKDKTLKVQENGKTKKMWLKDEVIADMDKAIKGHMAKNRETNKSMNDWRNKYFSLLATKQL